MTNVSRFWSKVDKGGPMPVDPWRPVAGNCWLWTAATSAGYGAFWVHGRVVKAHRYAYQSLVGSIPIGLQVDHLCRVPNCVRPEHLELVTSATNTMRGRSFSSLHRTKTHCPSGHPYAGTNLAIYRGHRACRRCNVLNVQRWRQRQRLSADGSN